MVKRFISAIGDSIQKYIIETILHSLLFKSRNKISNGILFWLMLISITITDAILAIDKKQELFTSIIAGLTVVLVFLSIGYGLFLIFDYIPVKTIIKRILPIRDKLDEIITNSKISQHSFTEPYDIENINRVIKLERVPENNVLEVWLYKLKVQRNTYIILSPLFYLTLTAISLMFHNTHIVWVDSIYSYIDSLIKSPPILLQVLKWAFITNVVTNEAININIDISRVELLKGFTQK